MRKSDAGSLMGCVVMLVIFSYVFDFLVNNVGKSTLIVLGILVAIFIILGILGILGEPTKCDICGKRFGKRSKRFNLTMDDQPLTLCARCNSKVEQKQSGEKFSEFWSHRQGKQESNTGGYVTSSGRSSISTRVKKEVWNRDGGCCVQCGSNERLEYDHIIPVSKGGSNTSRNIQLLCEQCNRSKSDKII